MPSIAEQLAAASITDSLQYGSPPSEAIWKMLGFSSSRGTFSASGWQPPGYLVNPPHEARGGASYRTTKLTGGNGFVYFHLQNNASLLNGAEWRSDGLWLFTTGEFSQPDGYQLLLKQASSGTTKPQKWIFILSKYEAGFRTIFEESGEVTVEQNGGFALAKLEGQVSMWRKETAVSPWVQVGTNKSDSVFKENYSGFQGNGSNPLFWNFSTGVLLPDDKAIPIPNPHQPYRGLVMR